MTAQVWSAETRYRAIDTTCSNYMWCGRITVRQEVWELMAVLPKLSDIELASELMDSHLCLEQYLEQDALARVN